ncbi:hypothetical protein [Nonomuraea typhae]|uniref:PASTA domain-containing protein n=1 Tax=Nonomuraea typhae TaxID=2603600 RepID=A0ABW7YY77_9ACTN
MTVFPEERDLPEGRHHLLKEFVMTEIQAAPRRRLLRPMVLAPVLGLAAAAAVALPLVFGGGAPAHAVEKNPDGTLTVTVNEAKDPKALEANLKGMGYDVVVDFVPDGKQCSPRKRSASWVPKEDKPLSVFPPTVELAADEPSFQIDPTKIGPGQTGVLMFAVTEEAGHPTVAGIWARISNGPVAACELVDSDGAPLDVE